MPDFPLVEYIDPDLEVLIDRFFELSRVDLEMMRDAIGEGNFDTLVRLGHTVKGTGQGYGFTGMGEIGSAIEKAALGRDLNAAISSVDRMDHYLDNVEVKFSK